MNAYALAHPWLTFLIVLYVVFVVANVLMFLINRPLRHWNIRKHGYPPPHCDADGDFRVDCCEDDDKGLRG